MAQVVNSYQDVTQPSRNAGVSELTSLIERMRENSQRNAQNQAILEEQKRQANQASDYRNRELAARQASEDRYFNTQTGQTEDAKREMAARAQFGYKSLQQDMKTLEADFNNATSHVKRLSAKIMAAGVSPDQLQSLMDGTAKAPAALEQDVKNLIAAGSAQTQAMREADKVTSQYNQQFGIGVILGIDRKNGRFALTNPYVPGQTSSATQPGGVGGGGQSASIPSAAPASSGAGTQAGSAADERFFYGPPAPTQASRQAAPGVIQSQKEEPAPATGTTLGSIYQNYGAPAAAVATPYFAGRAASPLLNKAVDNNFGLNPVGRFFLGSKVVPVESGDEIVNRGGGREFYGQYGVPPNYNVTASSRPPTAEEIAAYRAARNARMGQVGPPAPVGYFRGQPVANPWDVPVEPYSYVQPENPGAPPGYWQP